MGKAADVTVIDGAWLVSLNIRFDQEYSDENGDTKYQYFVERIYQCTLADGTVYKKTKTEKAVLKNGLDSFETVSDKKESLVSWLNNSFESLVNSDKEDISGYTG